MSATNKSVAVHVEEVEEGVELLLAFPVADQWFALPAESVVAVVEADRLQPLSEASSELVGYVDIRGGKVLVRDMSKILVPGSSGKPAEQIILFRGVSSWAGLTTGGTAEMVSMSVEQAEEKSDCQGQGWRLARGTCGAKEQTIRVLDPEVLVNRVRPVC